MSKSSTSARADANNRANQMNPNNGAYWSSRGGEEATTLTPSSESTGTQPASEPKAAPETRDTK